MLADMEIFAALADPTRREIVARVARGPTPVSAIAARLPISAPAVSQHLKALREAGLVRVERRAQQRIYSFDPAGFDEIEQWLARTRATWNHRLDALEHALGDDEEKKR